MKSRKSFLLASLAALSLVFAMSCSSPTSSDSASQAEKVTITYKTDKGTAPEAKKVDKGYKLVDADIKALSADGFTFDGWFNGDAKAKAGDEIKANVTFTAKWTVKASKPGESGTTPEVKPGEGGETTVTKVTISYDLDNHTTDTELKSKEVDKGYALTKADLPEITANNGNTDVFEFWMIGDTQAAEGTPINESVSLKAKWRAADAVASVTFTPSTLEAETGETADVTLACDTQNVVIKYSIDSQEFNSTYSGSAVAVTAGSTIYAVAEKEGKRSAPTSLACTVKMHEVTFDSKGGSAVGSQSLAKGSAVETPNPAPTRTGYTFDGWYLSNGNADSAMKNISVNMDTAPITFFAKWTPEQYTISYDAASLNDVGNTANASKTYYTVENDVSISNPDERSGFTFAGWYDASEGGTKVTSTSGKTGNLTLYARWTNVVPNAAKVVSEFTSDASSATITFGAVEDDVTSIVVVVNATATLPTNGADNKNGIAVSEEGMVKTYTITRKEGGGFISNLVLEGLAKESYTITVTANDAGGLASIARTWKGEPNGTLNTEQNK